MTILEDIIFHKAKEVTVRKELVPVTELESNIYFNSPCRSLKNALLRPDKVGIIAELKRKSPSKGIINKNVSVEKTTMGYINAGASALSVLTETEFFGGKNDDLVRARELNNCPI